ncbi:B12-binding domain-containing radical SAM protein [Candidatus Bariatricus faecipullorum]
MKVLLAAVNAKYIHSCLAVYTLQAYARKWGRPGLAKEVETAEYTINQPEGEILGDIYRRRPDVLCFSCYIWNWETIQNLVREAKKVLPGTRIWLGGPEVSYDAEKVLRLLPQTDGVMRGEGEATFLELLEALDTGEGELPELEKLPGITWRDREEIRKNPDRPVLDMNRLPFIYQEENIESFAHKILYYESSRGCPFSCSYCLSSVEKCLRFRDTELVKQDLAFFLKHKVPQVKFVDRTFNCRHGHALEIWNYLAGHDNGVTNFHFEISADLLTEEELSLLETMRSGLVQLEIGVQSTNSRTIREIRRSMDLEKVRASVERVNAAGNIHQHLDLIAGLPFEDYESFRGSFNQVFAMKPEQLQLGFLKVLKGSYMEERKEDYQLVYQSRPPYEVLYTKWLGYDEVLRLKDIEEMVEVYYNSSQFEMTLPRAIKGFPDAFAFFETLADWYRQKGMMEQSHSRIQRYELLLSFLKEREPERQEEYVQLLTLDFYLRENAKNRPVFAGEDRTEKAWARTFYDQEEETHRYLSGYPEADSRLLRKMTHIETFTYDVLGNMEGKTLRILFDYQNRNPLNHQASIVVIE